MDLTDFQSSETLYFQNLPDGFPRINDPVQTLLLREYGAVYVARGGAIPPSVIVFQDEAGVGHFQSTVPKSTATIGGLEITLQRTAMKALHQAIDDARRSGWEISPRGPDSGARTYGDTVELWHSRVEPGLIHWVAKGRISELQAERIRSLSPFQQVSEILGLEEKGIYFAKDLTKSIIYSVAPPGTSQHLAMLAFDVQEFNDPNIRRILASHGWFQTVTSDLPHFTFLGVKEDELFSLGLRSVENEGRKFWIPDI